MVALLHGLVGTVHRDPLGGRNPEPHLLGNPLHPRLPPTARLCVLAVVLECQQAAGKLRQHRAGHAGHAAKRLKQPPESGILGLLIELYVYHRLGEKLEGRWSAAAQRLSAAAHLLFAHQVPLVLRIVALPRQPPFQQEQQGVCQRLQVIPAAGGAAKVGMDAGVAYRPSKHVGPLVVLRVGSADVVPPLAGQPQVHKVQALGVGCVGRTQQKVLGLHVAMHKALPMEGLQDGQRLHRDARHHLCRHLLPLVVPHVPQARPKDVHNHHVKVPLPAFVIHLWDARHAVEAVVDGPLVGRAVLTALAAAVLKFEGHVLRPAGVVAALAAAPELCLAPHIYLPKAPLPELPLDYVQGAAVHLTLLWQGAGGGLLLPDLPKAGALAFTLTLLVPSVLFAQQIQGLGPSTGSSLRGPSLLPFNGLGVAQVPVEAAIYGTLQPPPPGGGLVC
mmetsp:Transcript_3702/g.10701  ORF Transcript_3702/g.10701 Transcript_3702/m.10701 type:complete len:446 (+) Transcript_3702:1015-2352(+)